mmetsp:Transcript_121846/g.350242  ORF Transcript_121846/g.350242 Transcript_121846/m.350242 type:complete len:310 (+) Transcript_121846:416-1345(+)
MDTPVAFFADDTARAGCVSRAIHAMVSGGSTETSGELRCPSVSNKVLLSKAQPSRIKLCTLTDSGADEPTRSAGSKEDTRWRLSIETDNARAVCCRNAFRKTSGLRKSLNTTWPSIGFREEARLTQSLLSASTRLAKPCKNAVGSSGADGHVAVQVRGTSPRIKTLASATMSGVLRTVPAMIFCMVVSEFETKSLSLPASIVSMSKKATTGGSSGETLRTSTPRSLDNGPLVTLSHSWNRGPNAAVQALMSAMPALAPWAPAPLTAAASWRSIETAFVELILCSERSAFGAMPKLAGLSMSGSWSTRCR